MESYKKFRPETLNEIIGQASAVGVLKSMIQSKNIPHALLFTGPSGCGKTTLARILVKSLECGKSDLSELNCADFRGIDMVRDLRKGISLAPISGKARVWIIDECHQLTKDAQNGLLKMLEDTPSHAYFMLATTEPGKLIAAIKTRCTEVKVSALNIAQQKENILFILSKLKEKFDDDLVDKIVEIADGSARKAIVLVDSVRGLDEDERMEAVERSNAQRQGIEIAKALFGFKVTWSEMAKLIKACDEEPETVRRIILGYASAILLSAGKLSSRAYLVIQTFRDNWFDCGKAGLTACCYEVLTAK